MSDTPRTDKEIYQIVDQHDKWGKELHVDADFARALELENAQLRKEREELEKWLQWLRRRKQENLKMMESGAVDNVEMSAERFMAKGYYTACCHEQIKAIDALLAKLEAGKS